MCLLPHATWITIEPCAQKYRWPTGNRHQTQRHLELRPCLIGCGHKQMHESIYGGLWFCEPFRRHPRAPSCTVRSACRRLPAARLGRCRTPARPLGASSTQCGRPRTQSCTPHCTRTWAHARVRIRRARGHARAERDSGTSGGGHACARLDCRFHGYRRVYCRFHGKWARVGSCAGLHSGEGSSSTWGRDIVRVTEAKLPVAILPPRVHLLPPLEQCNGKVRSARQRFDLQRKGESCHPADARSSFAITGSSPASQSWPLAFQPQQT